MKTIKIQDRKIGKGQPCYIIAEVSCNHNGDYDEAVEIIKAAKDAGADAVKIQTYTADTMTRDFTTMPKGSMWEKMDLHGLYQKAQTPWEWYGALKKVADDLGLHFFSTPFDETAVDYLMKFDPPVFKIASFEAVDIKLIEKTAKTAKPVIISNGMTNLEELEEAVETLKNNGAENIAVLHCNSGYPARFEEANLNTIPDIAVRFDCVPGLSDHTLFADADNHAQPMAHVTPLEAVKLGANIIEVHLQMNRDEAKALFDKNEGGYDWSFSRDPAELKTMIDMIRTYETNGAVEYKTEEERAAALKTHGEICYEPTEKEQASRLLRPSLYVVKDMAAGDIFHFAAEDKEAGNFDSVRPSGGLHIRDTDKIEGKKAARNIKRGEPLSWDMVKNG